MADNSRPLKKRIIEFSLAILIIILIIIITGLMSSYETLIYDNESKYYKAKIILILNDYIVCVKESNTFTRRKNAIKSSGEDHDLAFIPITGIRNIEILQNTDPAAMVRDVPVKYLGKFKADVSGNIGYLYISLNKKKKKLFGTIRFPEWANGSYEPLKNLWIAKGKIGFIRSVDSAREAKRVGTSSYFVQEFYGEYKRKGNAIEGYYMNRGEKNVWKAYRIK